MATKNKGYIVNRAFSKIGISGITSPATPDDMATGLATLEEMMGELDSRNICTNFAYEDEPDPSTDSNIDSAYLNAAVTNLAVRVAPEFEIAPTPVLIAQANQSLSNWSARTSRTNQINYPRRQPRGSGNTFRYLGWYRYYRMENHAPISCETLQLNVDEVNQFRINFTEYLQGEETITSFETEVANGIELNSITQADGVFDIEVKGLQTGWQILQITFETSLGRTNIHNANFNVTQLPS